MLGWERKLQDSHHRWSCCVSFLPKLCHLVGACGKRAVLCSFGSRSSPHPSQRHCTFLPPLCTALRCVSTGTQISSALGWKIPALILCCIAFHLSHRGELAVLLRQAGKWFSVPCQAGKMRGFWWAYTDCATLLTPEFYSSEDAYFKETLYKASHWTSSHSFLKVYYVWQMGETLRKMCSFALGFFLFSCVGSLPVFGDMERITGMHNDVVEVVSLFPCLLSGSRTLL